MKILILFFIVFITHVSSHDLDSFVLDIPQTLDVSHPKHDITSWNQLKDLFGISINGGAIFNPKKNEIAFVSNREGVAHVFIQSYSNGKLSGQPKSILASKDRCTFPSYLDDGSLVFLHDRGGSEKFQIGHYDPITSAIHWVTNQWNSSHVYNHVSDKYMYYASNRRTRLIEIFRKPLPLSNPSTAERIYTPNKSSVATLAFTTKDDRFLFLEQSYSNFNSEIIVSQGKHATSATRSFGPKLRWTPIRFLDKNQTRMLVKTDYKSDFLRLAVLHFKDAKYHEIPEFITIPYFEHVGADVKSVEFVKKTRLVYVVLNRKGYSQLIRFSLNSHGKAHSFTPIKLPIAKGHFAAPGQRSWSTSLSVSRFGNYLAMTLSNAVTPTSMFLVNLKTKKHDQFVPTILPPSLQNFKFVGERLSSFESWDGLTVPYFIFKPKTEMPEDGYPTIVLLHGGPESQATSAFSPLKQFLVHSGYAVVEPNIRGSAGYGRKYVDLDNRYKRMHAMKDIQELTVHLKDYDWIDNDRLVVFGGSYGGYASLMSIVKLPRTFCAGVDIVGMSNLVTFLQNTAKWRRVLREPEYGYLHKDRKLLHSISPINFVKNARSPVYIIQGANDPRVPLSEAKQMYRQLKKSSSSRVRHSKLLVLKNEGHGFSKRSTRLLVYHSLIRWLNRVTKL